MRFFFIWLLGITSSFAQSNHPYYSILTSHAWLWTQTCNMFVLPNCSPPLPDDEQEVVVFDTDGAIRRYVNGELVSSTKETYVLGYTCPDNCMPSSKLIPYVSIENSPFTDPARYSIASDPQVPNGGIILNVIGPQSYHLSPVPLSTSVKRGSWGDLKKLYRSLPPN